MKKWLLPSLLLLGSALAEAQPTVVVQTTVESNVIDEEVFQSVLWHALHQDSGHEAIFSEELSHETVQMMRKSALTTLIEVHLSWQVDVLHVEDDRVTGGFYPVIAMTEWAIDGDQLVAKKKWTTSGTVSLYQLRDKANEDLLTIPELSLQRTVDMAIKPLEAPLWRKTKHWTRIPVSLVADEEYRSFYGEQWAQVAELRIIRANALLRPAGILLDIEHEQHWTSPESATNLSELLDNMSLLPRNNPRGLRIGFTQQTQLAHELQLNREDVGRAYLPGRDVLIADQAVAPGHSPVWDVADEGVAVAHEVLHALGVPHCDQVNALMSGTKSGTTHKMLPSTLALARTAAQARFSHWDIGTTLTSLSAAADTHLEDPELQFDYIAENLAYGPGVPAPGELEPRQLSALTNVAMGWYYLKKAEEEPRTGGPLMREALAHSESALYQKPGWVQATRLHSRALNIDTLPVPAVPEAPPPVIELPIPNACGTINTAMSSDIPDCN